MGKFGAKNWVFCDGDLPPQGENPEFQGHEALMITNVTKKTAFINVSILFEDKEPKTGLTLTLESNRVICIRLDKPSFDQKYQIPKGQYSLVMKSNVPVCACFGRLDVRQTNMAYYSLSGISY